jgi:hypothetical protein
VSQPSSVILSDVLGYSLQAISEIVGGSVPAVKAALQRGRDRLRALATEPDDAPARVLAEPERTRLKSYVERFNAHDFDAVRSYWPRTCVSSSSTGCASTERRAWRPISATTRSGRIGALFLGSSTAIQRFSSMTPTTPSSS